MNKEKIKEIAKNFNNKIASQLNPSNDTMEAVRLVHKELPEALQEYGNYILEEAIDEVLKLKQKYINLNEKQLGGYFDEIDTCKEITPLLQALKDKN